MGFRYTRTSPARHSVDVRRDIAWIVRRKTILVFDACQRNCSGGRPRCGRAQLPSFEVALAATRAAACAAAVTGGRDRRARQEGARNDRHAGIGGFCRIRQPIWSQAW